MTRPISEPTKERAIARVSYGQSQLERRPANASAGTLDSRSFACLVRNDDYTIADTTVGLPFNENDGSTNTNADEGAVSVFIDDDGVQWFQFNEPGIYSMYWSVVFDANFDGAIQVGFECFDAEAVFGWTGSEAPTVPLDYSDTQTRSQSERHCAVADKVYIVNDLQPGSFARFTPFLANWSAASRTALTMMAVAYQVTPTEAMT